MAQGYPVIKLEVQRMKQDILFHFGLLQTDISEQVQEQLEKVIKNFDFGVAVEEAAEAALHDVIAEFFKYGEGRKFLKRDAHEALSKLFSLKEGKDGGSIQKDCGTDAEQSGEN